MRSKGILWLGGLNLDGFPVAALAAYGILRVLREEMGLEGVRLVFRDPFSRPVAGLEGVGSQGFLLGLLAQYLRHTPPLPDELMDRGVEDLSPEEVRQFAAKYPRARLFLPALLVHRGAKKPFVSPLNAYKGQQSLSKILRTNWEAAQGLGLVQGLSQVLFGDVLLSTGTKAIFWKYNNRGRFSQEELDFQQVGWHPSQSRLWAERAREPEKDQLKIRIHPVAVLLAWEALPLFPLYLGSGGVRAAGIADPEYKPSLLLPTPGYPVSLEVLKVLILQAPLTLETRRPWPLEVALWRCPQRGGRAPGEPYPVFLGPEPALRASQVVAER